MMVLPGYSKISTRGGMRTIYNPDTKTLIDLSPSTILKIVPDSGAFVVPPGMPFPSERAGSGTALLRVDQ
jgi:hypothetical protein